MKRKIIAVSLVYIFARWLDRRYEADMPGITQRHDDVRRMEAETGESDIGILLEEYMEGGNGHTADS